MPIPKNWHFIWCIYFQLLKQSAICQDLRYQANASKNYLNDQTP